MKRKSIISVIVVAIILLSVCLAFASCKDNGVDYYYNLTTEGTVYFEGEQTISVKQEESSENKTTFLSTISAKDVSVSGVLVGKTVKSVNYLSETEILVTLDGKVTADKSHKEDTGTITVSHNALKNGADGKTLLRVNFEPKMSVTYNVRNTALKKYVSEFTLPYGYFITENVNADNIEVPVNDVTVNLSVTEEGALRIEVIGFEPFTYNGTTFNYPVAKINANVTTFNKELYVTVGELIWLGYDLI